MRDATLVTPVQRHHELLNDLGSVRLLEVPQVAHHIEQLLALWLQHRDCSSSVVQRSRCPIQDLADSRGEEG